MDVFKGTSSHTRPSPDLSGEVSKLIIMFIDTIFLLSFDLIHSRHLMGAISDWKTYLQQIYDSLKLVGWAQFAEYTMDLKSDYNRYVPCIAWRTHTQSSLHVRASQAMA